MIKSTHNIDTGKIIERLIYQFKFSNLQLERAIGRPGSSIYKYIRNSSIQTGILIDLCYAMKYNIFQEIANELPPEFVKVDKTADETLALKTDYEQRIADLKEENKILKAQLDIVMKLKG
jgi:rRNA maturation protein Rpf1